MIKGVNLQDLQNLKVKMSFQVWYSPYKEHRSASTWSCCSQTLKIEIRCKNITKLGFEYLIWNQRLCRHFVSSS